MHCQRYISPPISRREMLGRCAVGFGSVALSALLCDRRYARASLGPGLAELHHPARADHVIFLYMDGGVSQVDSFDPKPLLDREHGQPYKAKIEPTQFDNIGTTYKSHWAFKPRGECGMPVSELFPHVAELADDLCLIRSMVSEFSEHQTANYFLHTGFGMQGRPCMGAWFGYGLGTDNQDLPGFVVINGGLIPSGGLDNFGSGFLPAAYQGTMFRPREGTPIANIQPRESASEQRRKLDFIARLDSAARERFGPSDEIETAIVNYELAHRMQTAVPELADLNSETAATKALYGFDSEFEATRIFAAECLLARRMVEKGVRFVELTCPRIDGCDRWDAHSDIKNNHGRNAQAVDQPIAGLLRDLKGRGLLDRTLVVFTGEFGRTPFAQGSDGRDHNPFGFSAWLAGGGVAGGTIYGATDEYGYRAVENKVTIHDLHATMLYLLGVDHKRLTFRFSGRDMRLTDVHGEVVDGILA